MNILMPTTTAIALALATALPSGGAMAADAAKGAALAEQWCNACHSINTAEVRQADAGPRFEELAKQDQAFIMAALNRPHDFMPEFPKLSDADKADLAAYILSLR